MKNSSIRKFIDEIIAYDWVAEKRLDKIIIDIVYDLNYNGSKRDLYIDEFGDPNSKTFKKLILEIYATNERNIDCPQIVLVEKVDGFYISKISDNTTLYKKTITLLNSFDKKATKGEKYEKFCVNFFKNIGISAKATRKSNDKGIDIIGSYKVAFNSLIGNFIKYEFVYILAQSKYFSTPIDTPVIRKLVGDSLFIRFDDLEYEEIKHNAFHLIVISHNGFTSPAMDFAKRNKIELYDSQRIAHLISQNPETAWTCIDQDLY